MRILSLAIVILAATPVAAFAQKAKLDPGKQAYELQCAVCHGIEPIASTQIGTRT